MLRFTWLLEADDFSEECDVQLLCHHVARRGVHVPKAWKSKWNQSAEVPAVDALARAAVQRARDELSLSDATKLDCRWSLQTYISTYEHEHAHACSSTVVTQVSTHRYDHEHAYLSTVTTVIKVCC
jgi:hypothetical protein